MGRVFEAERPFQRGRRMRRRLSDGEKVFCVVVVGVLLLMLTNAGLVNDNLSRSVSFVTDFLGFTSSSIVTSDVPLRNPIVATSKKAQGNENKVPFEAHIMSKCPDAQYCLNELVVPAMERISDKVDFHLSFIGEYDNRTDQVDCMHGPTECIGDILMLCAANLPVWDDVSKLANDDNNEDDDEDEDEDDSESSHKLDYPKTSVIRSLGFANCLMHSYEDIPQRELVKSCALEHGIDFEALNRCASRQIDDPDEPIDNPDEVSGLALLKKSFRHSAKLGIDTSCTVRVDEEKWCIRNDGRWVQCGRNGKNSQVTSLVDHISALYDKRN
ncbi:hypothetical protein KEM54_005368 [Ascosphaera aggregata]|nr:hypothetical protein KEM54_005368 [Ascosphaera aggregata]